MKEQSQRVFYAMVGAPVVVARQLVDVGARVGETAGREYETWAKEGERVTRNVRKSEMVEELSNRVDMDQIQDQVEKLRDQIENALSSWREGFRPEKSGGATAKKVPVKKATTKRAPARKAPARKAPARKAPAKKAPAAKTEEETPSA